jgi:gliding motility-associated-like protein
LPIVISITDSFEIQYGDSVELINSIENGFGNLTYTWFPQNNLDCSNCQQPLAFPELTAEYSLTVIDSLGCNASATTTVSVIIDKTIYIPNAFSPNGDGENDAFFAFAKDLTFFSMKVFNRWGELIFATEDKNVSWDGTYKGKILPPSVFVYYAQFEFPDGQKINKKGTVTLIR